MHLQQTFEAALEAFKQGRPSEGMEKLRLSALAGHSTAALYYADNMHRQEPQKAYAFLLDCWERGIRGTLFRYALLATFFDRQAPQKRCFEMLHQEASEGHLESLLVLIDLLSSHKDIVRIYLNRLNAGYPELAGQMGLSTADYSDKVDPSEKELVPAESAELACQEFTRRLNIQFEPVSDEIGLMQGKAVLSKLESRYFQLRYSGLLKPSLVFDPGTGESKKNEVRTSLFAQIMPELSDWFSLSFEQRVASYTNTTRAQGEPANVLCYQPGQEYRPHYDALVGDDVWIKTELERSGQRIKTAICYLNNVSEGGATTFPKLGISIQPTLGDMILFNNVDKEDKALRKAYHAGEPVLSGEKWLLTKWIRQKSTPYGSLLYEKVSASDTLNNDTEIS